MKTQKNKRWAGKEREVQAKTKMVKQLQEKNQSLYEIDYNLWVLETVKTLKQRDVESLDWENLIDEVLDLSKREKRKIQNLLKRLFEHLLKLQYWEAEVERNRRHWRGEVVNFRQQIKYQLQDSPSLKGYLAEIFEQSYQDARAIASQKSGLPLSAFPESAIAPLETVLDETWLPE